MDIKDKDIEVIEDNIKKVNINFFERDQKKIVNALDTYRQTERNIEIKLKGNSRTVFSNPVMHDEKLLEIFPVLNLAKVEKKEYLMHVYLNAVKIISRKRLKSKKISKDSQKTIFLYGVSSKEVIVFHNIISTITDKRCNLLDKACTYMVAQMLYEAIEGEPFTLELATNEEKVLKQVKYYISKCYSDYRDFIVDYLTCNRVKIEKTINMYEKIDLQELEETLKKSLSSS